MDRPLGVFIGLRNAALPSLVFWGVVAALLFGCAEPPEPPPVTELPAPCELPMALNYLGECVPTIYVEDGSW